MSHLAVNCTPWKSASEWKNQQPISMNIGLKDHSSPQIVPSSAKQLSLRFQEQDSSSIQSTDQSNHEVAATGGTTTQDQCVSSESGQDGGYEKHLESQMKPIFYMANPDIVFNPTQVDCSHSMACTPYPYADLYFGGGGLVTAYGPRAIMQPHMVGISTARVPLPLDLAEDGPIYVNAKQYHGILRRRQSRAKMEAQNKLIKSRKPYLHESRHRHAMNRVRGSGGRFLSTKPRAETSDEEHIMEEICPSETGKCTKTAPYCTVSGFLEMRHQDYRFPVLEGKGSAPIVR